jgi:hypothetical protein
LLPEFSLGLSLSGSPVVRQKLGKAVNGMAGDAKEDIFEPGKGIDVHALAGCHEAA